MSDRVLLEEVGRLTGREPRHLLGQYPQFKTESDWAGRLTWAEADARRAYQDLMAANDRDVRIRQWWAGYADRRNERRARVWHEARASVPKPRDMADGDYMALQQQVGRSAVAAWEKAHPEADDMYEAAAAAGIT